MMPSWVTATTAATVGTEVRHAAATTVSRHTRDTHATLDRIRVAARRAALFGAAQRLDGLRPVFPFLDRHVVEAAMRTAPWQRTDPWRAKPLLVEALSPVAPSGTMSRRDKSHYDVDIYTGWRVHRPQIAEMLAAPRLADYGLVDAGVLTTASTTFTRDGRPPALLTDTLALELWLRTFD